MLQTFLLLFFSFFFSIVCFTSYFVFSIAVLPHSPEVVHYHLLFRQETRIPGLPPVLFEEDSGIFCVHRGQKSYTLTAFGKLWTTPGETCLIIIHDPGMRPAPESNRGPLD